MVTVHSPGFAPGEDEAAVRAAVARLEIEHPVCIDLGFELWRAYDNEGWPARYLWDGDGHLAEYHYGEGGYAETELAIQELLGVEREPIAPLHPEDDPDALIAAQTPDQPGAYSGPYGAGAVWAVLGGAGELHVNGERGRRAVARCPPARRAQPPRQRRARPAGGCGRDLLRHLLHAGSGAAGGLSAAGVDRPRAAARSAGRRRSRARPRRPGQYGLPQWRSRYIDS